MTKRRENFFDQIIRGIPSGLLNKYVLATLVFVVWMIFFDNNRLPVQLNLNKEINRLDQDIEYLEKEIVDKQKVRSQLNKDRLRYIRQKYYLKKKDEDVFIIDRKKS